MALDLYIGERLDIPAKQTAVIVSTTEVTIPDGHVGIIGIRRVIGDKYKLTVTSNILWSGFTGFPELHVSNQGGDVAELRKGDAIAHVAIVKEYAGE